MELRDQIHQRFGVQFHERNVGKLMARLNFSRDSMRLIHPAQDPATQEAHTKTLPSWLLRLSQSTRDKPIELWWQDEARVGQQGRLTYIWADKGSWPCAPRDQRYDWAYIFGAVCPAHGIGAALVLPIVNTEAMNQNLAEISTNVAAGAHAVVTLDGAAGHQQGSKLKLPHNISLLPLPPYSPELNPVENVWQFLKYNYLANGVFEKCAAVVDACCDAWNKLVSAPENPLHCLPAMG